MTAASQPGTVAGIGHGGLAVGMAKIFQQNTRYRRLFLTEYAVTDGQGQSGRHNVAIEGELTGKGMSRALLKS